MDRCFRMSLLCTRTHTCARVCTHARHSHRALTLGSHPVHSPLHSAMRASHAHDRRTQERGRLGREAFCEGLTKLAELAQLTLSPADVNALCSTFEPPDVADSEDGQMIDFNEFVLATRGPAMRVERQVRSPPRAGREAGMDRTAWMGPWAAELMGTDRQELQIVGGLPHYLLALTLSTTPTTPLTALFTTGFRAARVRCIARGR